MSCPGLPDVVLTNCWWVSSILMPCPTPTPICQAWNCLSTISMATSPQPVPRALAKSRLGRASQLPSRRERSFSRMLRNSPGLGVQRPRAKSCLCSLTWFESPAFTQSMFAHLDRRTRPSGRVLTACEDGQVVPEAGPSPSSLLLGCPQLSVNIISEGLCGTESLRFDVVRSIKVFNRGLYFE